PRTGKREPDPACDRVDQPGIDLDLADRADGPAPRLARDPLQLNRGLAEHERRIEPEVHRRRARVVAAAVDDDVCVHVAGYRLDDADPITRVLEDPRLLD